MHGFYLQNLIILRPVHCNY